MNGDVIQTRGDAAARQLTVLRWAAGADLAPPTDFGDVEELLALVGRHRLAGRLLARMTGAGHAADAALWAALREQFATVRERAERQLAAAVEIDQAWGEDERRPVLFKGLSGYALSGRTELLRHSGDIDIVCGDPRRLRELLLGRGYEELRHHDSGHEMSVLHRDGVYLELHRYTPVCRVTQPPGFRHDSEIGYPVFAAHHLRLATASGPVTVPTPALAAVIACTNLYKDYALNGYPRPYGTVPLGLLAEVLDFADDPRFQPDEFAVLVNELPVQPSVALVIDLLDRHLGQVPDALRTGAAAAASQPRNLAVGFVFVDPTLGAHERLLDDLVLRRGDYGDYLACLAPDIVTADPEGPFHGSLSLAAAPLRAARRRDNLEHRFRFRASDDGLCLDIEIRNDGSGFEAVVDFGDHCLWGQRDETGTHVNARVFERLSKTHGRECARLPAQLTETGGVARFTVAIPRAAYADAVTGQQLPALVALRRYHGDDPAVAAPLRITLPTAPIGGQHD